MSFLVTNDTNDIGLQIINETSHELKTLTFTLEGGALAGCMYRDFTVVPPEAEDEDVFVASELWISITAS